KNFVAIKEISAEAAAASGGIEQFKQEALLLQTLKHEHLVGYVNYDEYRNRYYLITELVEGHTLHDLIKNRQLMSEGTAIDMIIQVLDGLGYAHRKGVVHRDIKPPNVMIKAGNIVVVLDFGISRSGGSAGHTMFVASGAYTPHYAPPEQK